MCSLHRKLAIRVTLSKNLEKNTGKGRGRRGEGEARRGKGEGMRGNREGMSRGGGSSIINHVLQSPVLSP